MPESEAPSTKLKAEARKLFAENSPKIIFVSLLFVTMISTIAHLQFQLPGTLSAYTQYVGQIAAGTDHSIVLFLSFLTPAGIVAVAVLWTVSAVIRTGLMSYCLKIIRRERSSALDILDGLLCLVKIKLILIISTVLTLLWSLLLVVPGIIAFYRYRQAYYILLDDPTKSAIQCIRESKLLMRGNKFDLFLVDVSFSGWFMLSALFALITIALMSFSLPLASVWTSPYAGLSYAKFYDNLLKKVTA